MLKYWVKLLKTDNCIMRNLYINLHGACSKNNVSNWLSEVRTIKICIGMNDVWQKQLRISLQSVVTLILNFVFQLTNCV